MSATFWNMRRRKRAAELAKAAAEKASAVAPVKEQAEKPVKKGGGKNGK